jgi:hypothetical protein
MAWASVVGTVTSPSNGKRYDVKWNSSGKDAYVSYAGWSFVGNASSESEALSKATSWLASNS